MPETLGRAIRRLRTEAGHTLRGFAKMIGISAAHQSDIEHGRRLPGDAVLRETAKVLRHVGASYESLRALDARLESDLQEWLQRTPEAGQLLRRVRDSGRSPREVLEELKQVLNREDQGEGDE